MAPLDAVTVARASGKQLSPLGYASGVLRWVETRPEEGGRAVVMDERAGELTPPGAYARTRVHEYGGGAAWQHGDEVFYSEFTDGRVHRVGHGPVTPEAGDTRYADGAVSPDGTTVYCVRERHEGKEIVNDLVSFATDGSAAPQVVASGRDFYAAPRPSADGSRLAWLEWDHPRMPWDGTELVVDGELVAGGPEESVLAPAWSPDGRLHWLSDRTGWWNLYRDGEQLTTLEGAEIGFPAWVFAMTRYAILGDGRIVCVVTRDAVDDLGVLEDGELRSLGLEWTGYGWQFAVDGTRVAFTAASPTSAQALHEHDLATGETRTVARSLEVDLEPSSISVPRAIEFPTSDGEGVAHAFYYPPNPPVERPPLRVVCHGGPTAHNPPELDLKIQYFTSRGIGVVDVNYRGSTGFGRDYRRLLNGRWGVIDWQDCVAAARYLGDEGEIDPERTWVEGGSAGGYVVFCALTFEPRSFAAGVSYFGVADVEALALETHKFESRYLDSMIGPYPEQADVYRARSPIHFADRLERPMLLLQGLDDKVVLPAQAEMMVDVLARKGIEHEYIAFEGEGHGFRKEENIVRSLEATLDFVSSVF